MRERLWKCKSREIEWTLMVLSKFLFFHLLGNQTKTEKELRNDFA